MKNVYFVSRGRRLASCKTFVRNFSSKKRQKRFEMAAAKTVKSVKRKRLPNIGENCETNVCDVTWNKKGFFLATNSRDVITEVSLDVIPFIWLQKLDNSLCMEIFWKLNNNIYSNHNKQTLLFWTLFQATIILATMKIQQQLLSDKNICFDVPRRFVS